MTNKEILEKAIQKAIDGGFRYDGYPERELTVRAVYYYFDDDHGDLDVDRLIWRHDFAKALWGNKKLLDLRIWTADLRAVRIWQYHLMQMVIADDPIQYLGDHIDD